MACSALCLVAASYHAMVLVGVVPRLDGSPLRHAVFIALGVGGAVAFHRRPSWLPIVFAAFTVQQLIGHGVRAWRWWATDRSIDWLSLAVMVTAPLACVLLFWERWGSRSASASGRER